MIIYKNKKLVLPVGLAPNITATQAGIFNQDKTADSSSNFQVITYDAALGFTGLGSVTINPYTTEEKTVDSSIAIQIVTGDNGPLSKVTVNPYVLGSLDLDSSTARQEYSGAYSNVVVKPYTLEEVTVDSSTNPQVITSVADGLSKVNINPYVLSPLEVDSSTATQELTGSYSSVKVNPYTLDSSYMTITQTGLYSVTAADMGVDGLSRVDVDVQGGGGNPEAGQGDPSTGSVTYYPNYPYDSFSEFTVNAVDASIDSNIQSDNIKAGITILGCTGTYTGSQFYRLEWASNGDRCLYRDTGINVTEDTYIECTLSFGDQQTEQVGYGYFWGVRDSNFGGQCFNMREFGGYNSRQVQFNNPSWSTWTQDLPHAPRTWTFGQMDPDGTGQNNYSFYRYNGVIDKRDPYTITDGYSINTIYLWAQNNDGQGVDEYSDREVRIHEFKVWQNGQLARHIVPVTSNDGGPEMFDLISMEVLPGEGYLVGGPRYEEVDLDNYIENGVYDGSVGNVYFNIGPYLYDFTNKSAYSDQYLEIVASLPEAPTTLGDASAYTLFGCRNSRSDEGVLVDYELAYPLYGGLPTIDCTAGDQSDSWVDSSTSNGLHTIELTSCYAHGGASNTCQTALILDGIPKMVEAQLSNSSDNNDNYIFACHSIAGQGLDTVTGFSMTGTRIYKITYYNCDDGVLHVLVPAYNNGQYCFLDKSTETYIYASAGTPTGYIKNKYYDDCVDIHDNRT